MVDSSSTDFRVASVAAGHVAWLEAGEGPALVLLHGIGSGARSWRAQLDGLSDRFRTIAWNAPGYGESSPLAPDAPSGSPVVISLAIRSAV
jgi:pimeloyl-ACP methyl ester carboxylesterase